ncbi:MAG TPA: hypothetical protein VG106_02715, partial [Vicinamibacterales bacterium]|nr:hypothetical protein [Vicinamibacterales bacterium]
IVWGPLAGYFARRLPVSLDVSPLAVESDAPALPFAFDISMGVRRGNRALKETLDAFIVRRQDAIDRLLADYGVPRADRRNGGRL